MGTVFRYIHDGAMFACSGLQCHHCGSEANPVYDYFGFIVNPELAADSKLATDDPDIYEVCASCILGVNVRKRIVDSRIQKTINRFARDKIAAMEEYYRTPDIPLFLQHKDWPMCCGEWCEFVGVPGSYEESREVPQSWHYWEHEPCAWEADYELVPESLREVSLFKCLSCEKPFFTWQFT